MSYIELEPWGHLSKYQSFPNDWVSMVWRPNIHVDMHTSLTLKSMVTSSHSQFVHPASCMSANYLLSLEPTPSVSA